jgi:hypothetical protein
MVQCTEAWFVADPEALASYYGSGFNAAVLPQHRIVESVAKDDVLSGLRNATARARRGAYHKTSHGFDLLGRIDPSVVRPRAPHAERFFATLAAL